MMMRSLILALGLSLLATPSLAVSAPVAASSLKPGTVLTEADLVTAEFDAAQARGIVTRMGDVVGKELKRSIAAGQPLRPYDVKEPELVKKGDLVTLSLSRGPMMLAAVGRALDAGARGATVRVQNASSKLIVQGEVTGQGAVAVRTLMPAAALAAR